MPSENDVVYHQWMSRLLSYIKLEETLLTKSESEFNEFEEYQVNMLLDIIYQLRLDFQSVSQKIKDEYGEDEEAIDELEEQETQFQEKFSTLKRKFLDLLANAKERRLSRVATVEVHSSDTENAVKSESQSSDKEATDKKLKRQESRKSFKRGSKIFSRKSSKIGPKRSDSKSDVELKGKSDQPGTSGSIEVEVPLETDI